MGKEKHRDGWLEKLLSKLGLILFWRSVSRREGWFGFREGVGRMEMLWRGGLAFCGGGVGMVRTRLGVYWCWGGGCFIRPILSHISLFFKKNRSPPFQTLVILQHFLFPTPPSLLPHFYYFVKPVRNSL